MDTNSMLEKVMKLEKMIEENKERSDVILTLAAKGYIDPALFNAQSNELKTEATKLKEQKTALTLMLSDDRVMLTQAEKLLKHLHKQSCVVDQFDENSFKDFVEKIEVYLSREIGFKLKCGICLKERVGR